MLLQNHSTLFELVQTFYLTGMLTDLCVSCCVNYQLIMMSLQLSFEAFAHPVLFQELITLVKELATGNKFVLYMCVVHCPELSQIYLWKGVYMPQRSLPFIGLLSKARNTVHTYLIWFPTLIRK
jgi:hypothetical protein